jgi:hypothetical protein
MIQSLLIANRGEIACRIIRTLRALTFGRLRLVPSCEPIAAFGSGPSVPLREPPPRDKLGEEFLSRVFRLLKVSSERIAPPSVLRTATSPSKLWEDFWR